MFDHDQLKNYKELTNNCFDNLSASAVDDKSDSVPSESFFNLHQIIALYSVGF